MCIGACLFNGPFQRRGEEWGGGGGGGGSAAWVTARHPYLLIQALSSGEVTPASLCSSSLTVISLQLNWRKVRRQGLLLWRERSSHLTGQLPPALSLAVPSQQGAAPPRSVSLTRCVGFRVKTDKRIDNCAPGYRK